VTVALTGDGGDETFGGYTRYFEAERLAQVYRLPYWSRQLLASAAQSLSPSMYDCIVRKLGFILPLSRKGISGHRIHKMAEAIAHRDMDRMYDRFISQWLNPELVVIGGAQIEYGGRSMSNAKELDLAFISKMMLMDTVGYLVGDILVKLDRASMSIGLEARSPLLDDDVIEYGWKLPLSQKVRCSKGKWLLHKLLGRYVPSTLYDRPKMGFGIPLNEWLCGPLREWAEDLLSEHRLRSEGIFRPDQIRTHWNAQLNGTGSHGYALWNILMLQAWQAERARWGCSYQVFEMT
jgi:asparagine synthase (glutamine-hydrolysing)